MKDRFGGLSWPFVPLVLVALLAPILGGQVSTDSGAIHPGFGFLLAAVGSGPEAPTLTHALLGLVLAIAALGALLGRRVIQMPSTKLLAPALILFGLIPLSVASSSFKGVSAAAAAEWSLYLVAMLTVVALAGRRVGPTALCGTIFAACIWIARRGILEYIDTKDPTWRIFAGWTPNSLAGMLLIGLFVGLGLALVVRRPWSLLFLVGLVPIFYALLLTQSKGAVIAGIAGLGVLGALFAVSRARAPALPWVGRLVIAGLLMITMGTLFAGGAAPPSQPMAASSQPGAANVLNRFTQAGATQDQSAGFRRLLWQSSARLIVANPSGWGIGTFRGESARPGLTTQTQLAHSNLWQLGVEASPFAPVSLLALLAVWLEVCLRSGAALQPAQNRLRFAIVAAVAA
ncbi:MAG: O-antigen ligase family protein, partial [Fimbriimonas ginsengisoli]|nr:O-antigen ligase family protein [Fimbriimonas ginsengisoli]